MTASGLWQDIGAGENFFTRLFRFVFLLAAAAAFCFLAILPLTWPQQAVLGTDYPAAGPGHGAQVPIPTW